MAISDNAFINEANAMGNAERAINAQSDNPVEDIVILNADLSITGLEELHALVSQPPIEWRNYRAYFEDASIEDYKVTFDEDGQVTSVEFIQKIN